MSTDDILRAAIECQLITTGNRDSFYAAALVRFANLVRTESLGEQPARVPLTDDEIWNNDAIMEANSGYGASFETLRDIVRAVEAALTQKVVAANG